MKGNKDIEAKLLDERKALEELEQKRKKLDEKIAQKKKKIEDYENIQKTQLYENMDKQLGTLGLSREELLNALMNGDLIGLQDKIMNKQMDEIIEYHMESNEPSTADIDVTISNTSKE